MTSRLIVPVPSVGVITVIFRSRLARLLGYGDDTNLCLTPNAHEVCVECDWIRLDTFRHEVGHTRQAAKRGKLYLPWVLTTYAIHGYRGSRPEREAGEWADANAALFTHLPPYLYAGMTL